MERDRVPKAAIGPPATPSKRRVAELAVGFCVALVALFAFAYVADRVYDQEAFALDAIANPFLHAISSPLLDSAMYGITSLGSVLVVLIFVLAEGILVSRRQRAEALFLAVAIGGSVALNAILKVFIQRPRPALPWAHVLPDYSFPSGHTMNAVVFYLAIALIIWVNYGRRAGSIAVVVALVIAVAVGFSRIYLGYHYFSDVIGGFAAGLGWLFVVALAFETLPGRWAGRRWAWRRRVHPT